MKVLVIIVLQIAVAKSGDPWIEYYDIKVETESEMKRKVRIEGTIQGLEPATGVISINTLDDQYDYS